MITPYAADPTIARRIAVLSAYDKVLYMWAAGETSTAIAAKVGWRNRGSVTRFICQARENGDARASRRRKRNQRG